MLIQGADRVDGVALHLPVDAGRVRKKQYWLSAAAELDALIDGGQKSAAPIAVAAAGTFFAAGKNDEGRQVLGLAAEAIRDPGSHARAAEQLVAGVHQDLARRVVEGV